MFHISDCKKYSRCPRLFHIESFADKQEYRPFVRLSEEISDLAAQKLGIGECFTGNRGDDPSAAIEAMERFEWLAKARFEYRQLRIKVPFLHKNGNGWDVYFLFAGLYPHADDMQFYCDTAWVLKGCGIQVKNWYMIHLNPDYVRGLTLDAQQLFIISTCFYNSKNNPSHDIGKAIEANLTDISAMLDEMDRCLECPVPAACRTNACAGRQKCRHYEDCFEQEAMEPDNSITTLIGARFRYDMKREGIERLKEADETRIEGTRQQYAQIRADENSDGLFVDYPALHAWLKEIRWPIAFLDFEWERFAIPPYYGMKPYDVLPFEYSVDILYEDGRREHKVYLSIGDDRKELAESLIRDIPGEGSVIAYNAEGAEKIRIRELADVFPEYADRLLAINSRMEDLQLPFESGIIYDVRMRGQWSLKVLMSMMDDPGYEDLDIRQGMDAVFEWRLLDQKDEVENREQIIENLKAYCGMDSYAMTVIFRWLTELDQKGFPDC